MYLSISEFVEDWNRESGNSLKVERMLTDASLSQKGDAESNSLGKIAWHMVVMIGLTAAGAGLTVDAPPRGTEPPATAAAIADAYERAARSLAEQASARLKDDQMGTEITLFGRTMKLAAALQGLIRHQIHHRGQMTILMRSAGLTVPGVYGPSREEAAAMRAKQAQGR